MILVKCFFFIILRCLYDQDHKMTGASATLEINLSRTKLYMYYHQVSNLGDAFHAFSYFYLQGKERTIRQDHPSFSFLNIKFHTIIGFSADARQTYLLLARKRVFFSPPSLLLTHHDHFFRSHRSSKTYINMHVSWPHGDKN